MPLKNYTSSIAASRSIMHITQQLVKHGATQILTEYDPEGRVASLAWMLTINGRILPFRLPSNIAACEKVLRGEVTRRTRPETLKKLTEQAERTAWKILADWVDAQMAMVTLAQVDFLEVFLPYVYDPSKQQTYYGAIKASGFKALPYQPT